MSIRKGARVEYVGPHEPSRGTTGTVVRTLHYGATLCVNRDGQDAPGWGIWWPAEDVKKIRG